MVHNLPERSTPERNGDEIFDELKRKMYSDKRAYIYTVDVVLMVLFAGPIIGIADAIVGDPTYGAGKPSSLCSRTWEISFLVVSDVISPVSCLLGF